MRTLDNGQDTDVNMAAVISTGSSLCVLASALSTHRVFSGFYSYMNPSTNHVGIKSHKTQQQSHRREEREGRRKEILTPRRQKKGKRGEIVL